jgi:hypothetical protein
MANNTVVPSKRGMVRFGRGVTQVVGTTAAKRGGEIGLTRIRETFFIAAASTSQRVLIADEPMEVVAIMEAHSVAGGASAALQIEKLTGTQAPGAGTVILQSALDLTATVNTTVTATLVSTTSTLQLAAGESLAFKFSGTLTGLVGSIVIVLRRIP